MRPTFIIATSVAALLTITGPAQAQANRTFVSGQGSDSNPCSLTAPCRSFAGALAQTNPGGEIAVLDTAGYGAVTITKSISIVNEDGVEAGVTVTSGDGIDISVGATDVVNLRGLTLTSDGLGINGIKFTNLGALNIQNCVIRGFAGNGLSLNPTGTAAFNVSDTIIANNFANGIELDPIESVGTVTATFNRVQAIGNANDGFFIDGQDSHGSNTNCASPGCFITATIANSTASSNANAGVFTLSDAITAIIHVMVSNSVVSNNLSGVGQNNASNITYLAKNTITGNTNGAFFSETNSLLSFGDNYIKGNGDDLTEAAIPLVATK